MTAAECPAWCSVTHSGRIYAHIGTPINGDYDIFVYPMRHVSAYGGVDTDEINIEGVGIDLEDSEQLAAIFDQVERPTIAQAIRDAADVLYEEAP